MNQKLQSVINKQINAEFYSAYMYLSMAAYFEDANLPGFANWMRVQFQEEQFHAMKFLNFLVDRGARVVLDAIEKPKTEWNSPLHVFEEALAHERLVTQMINDIAEVAEAEKDRPTRNLCVWFIDEQVEEESSAEQIVNELKMIGDSGVGLLQLDREFQNRVFTEPTA